MPLTFEQTMPQERPEVVQFLLTAFKLPPESPFVQPVLLDWKYEARRPDWQGSRSYVYRRDGRIMVHGCIWPVTYLPQEGPVTSMRVIDWAGDRSQPGSGAMLMRKMTSLTDTVLAVGGSEETQKVVPAIGFRTTGRSYQYAKVIRPWRQMLTYPRKNWKTPARLVRNGLWSLAGRNRPPETWSWRAIERFGPEHEAMIEDRPLVEGWIPCARSAAVLNYMLSCPVARMSAFVLEEGGATRGYVLLSHMAGQTRIADLHVTGGEAQAWNNAYALAALAATADPKSCELMAFACSPHRRTALEACGFRLLHDEPVFLYDPRRRLLKEKTDLLPLDLQLLDGDEFFLADPERPYLT